VIREAPAPEEGVVFPSQGGVRPSSPTGRAVLAAAARAADPGLGTQIEAASGWRGAYVGPVKRLTELAGRDGAAALAIAEAGLAAAGERLELVRDGRARPLRAALDEPAARALGAETIRGTAPPARELELPYGGRRLRGAELLAQLERWVAAGVVEPSLQVAVTRVVEHPEWLRLPGRRLVALGAAAEMGPLRPLCAWGADVLAVDVPDPAIAERIAQVARAGAGTVTIPVGPDGRRGANLLRELPELRAWLDDVAGGDALVLGTYAYAVGGAFVRLSAAADVLARALLAERPGTALAYLATPTDAYVVPAEVVAAAQDAWAARRLRRAAQAPLRLASRGRLFAPAYGAKPIRGSAVADALVPQQGPNYALAKRLQRWRGVVAEQAGHPVSFNVAPATWTRSVTQNRLLAAAYAGAGRFGVEIFAPETSRVLMAALLVHDLHRPPARRAQPETLFSDAAAHGGLWRAAYEPRSVLGVAALAGLPAALVRTRRRAVH
jgi:hypothetical protein